MSWKTLESPGSNQRHLTDRKILRFINSAKSSATKQMVHWWILGACLYFPIKKTKWDVDNGHSNRRNADRLTLINTATLSLFQDSVPGRVYAGLRRCMQARSHPEHAAAKRGHHRLFFFWSEKKGGSSAPSEPPLATCLGWLNVMNNEVCMDWLWWETSKPNSWGFTNLENFKWDAINTNLSKKN